MNRQKLVVVGAVVLVLIVAIFIWHSMQPTRSVAAYCKVYGQEKSRLSAMSDNANPYSSGLFNVSVTDASQIATSLNKLDRVAPKEIEPMIHSLGKLYQDIHNNPSHAINNALNGGTLDDSLRDWTKSHCSVGS